MEEYDLVRCVILLLHSIGATRFALNSRYATNPCPFRSLRCHSVEHIEWMDCDHCRRRLSGLPPYDIIIK